LDSGDDAAQSEFVEAVVKEGTSSFGGETLSPVRASEIKGECPFVGDDGSVIGEVRVDATISDVLLLGLVDGGMECELGIAGFQMSVAELAFGIFSRARGSSDVASKLGIGFDRAVCVEIIERVRAEDETFCFEDEHEGIFHHRDAEARRNTKSLDTDKYGFMRMRDEVRPPSAEWKALRAVLFPALKRWTAKATENAKRSWFSWRHPWFVLDRPVLFLLSQQSIHIVCRRWLLTPVS
jgi:hypothetical protein